MGIRILHIVTYMDRGGLETMLMNCYRHIDRAQIQFDFLVHREFRADYDDEIESLGGRIYRLPRLNPFSPGYKKALLDFFKGHPEYRIVHCHLDCMSAIPLAAAKKCGVPVRIAHAHSNSQDKDWKYLLKLCFLKKIPAAATHLFACSEAAGDFMFPGQAVTVIKNGIESDKFRYDPALRAEIRRELGLGDELVLGHVGRFMPVKNHAFLIDVLAETKKLRPDARLLLVGEGPLKEQTARKAEELGLADSVLFLGLRSDVHRILQAADVFGMPSLYEGLGIAAVEAQAAGLPCVLSDTVPGACKLTDPVEFLPLEESPALWAEHILAAASAQRRDTREQIVSAGYDIRNIADYLQEFYTEMW